MKNLRRLIEQNWTAAVEQILSSGFLFRQSDGNYLLASLINEYNY